MSNYLIHSSKGTTWSKHKYIKKIGNRYIYKSTLSKDVLKGLTDDVMSGKLGTGNDLKNNLGEYYTQVMSSVNGKFKKPGSGKKGSSKSSSADKKSSGGSSSKSEKNSSSKESENKTTNNSNTEGTKSLNDVIKNSIKKAISVGDKDSIYATKNEDRTTTVKIDFEDGSTQTLTLNQNYEVIDKGKEEKQITHSLYKGNNYLIHRFY